MKKNLLILAMLLIGSSGYDQSGAAGMLLSAGMGLEEHRSVSGNDQVLEVSGNNQGGNFSGAGAVSESGSDEASGEGDPGEVSGNDRLPEENLSVSGNNLAGVSDKALVGDTSCLQIPAKLDVVIDPWELDGQGQIYSSEYVICNKGEVPGMLRLSGLACQPGEGKELDVKNSERDMSQEMHEGEEKAIYMELVFGNGDRVVLSQEGTEYEVHLVPGEEFSLHFEGQVNESVQWRDGDVNVTAAYFWEPEETLSFAEEP